MTEAGDHAEARQNANAGTDIKMKWFSGSGALARMSPVLTILAVLVTATNLNAQGTEWWENMPGFGVPGSTTASTRTPREKPAQDKIDDLRATKIPWRSEEMLEAIDDAIDRYQRIAKKGGWPKVAEGRLMRPGDDGDERVTVLRRRLRLTGDLKSRDSGFETYNFDSELEEAVRRFQERHGLRVSGRVDRATFAALNVTAEARLAQLVLNRERVRDLVAQPLEERYILVNVPAFQLEAVERYETVQRHRVIAGRVDRQTPVMRATIKAVNFFPYWRVPDSVAQLDLIPRGLKDPSYLTNEKIRIFQSGNGTELAPEAVDWNMATSSKLKFKQDPGPQNALGLVRIDMSNEHGVYMHDTPLKKLFDQRGRAFSAGCVRVQNVFELVEWIARFEPGWETPGQAQEVVDAGVALDVSLSRPMPVYFAYITAWAEPNGRVDFRTDIYNQDGRGELSAGGEREADDPAPPVTLAP